MEKYKHQRQTEGNRGRNRQAHRHLGGRSRPVAGYRAGADKCLRRHPRAPGAVPGGDGCGRSAAGGYRHGQGLARRHAQRQRELKDDAKVLEDSLFALSKRVVQIQNIVNTEIAAINYNLGKTILNLQDRFVPQARADQQYVMTSVNNIALILTEAFNQMQQQMQSQQQMQGSCKKPGKGKPSPSAQKLRQMQQQLNEQMKALQKKMDGKKEGQKGKPGEQGSMSEELARMAAQQEAIRNELQQLSNQENKDGNGSLGNLDQLAKEMEQTEKDLVNRRINQETIKRQEDILTRLLESEKALKERGFEEKRESTSGKNVNYGNLIRFDEYKRNKLGQVELLRAVDPLLTKYYKDKAGKYFNQF